MENVITNPIEQVKKHENMKETYGFVKTDDILQAFSNKGWEIQSQDVANTRKQDKVGYQKHLIRLVHPDHEIIPGLREEHKSRPQLCLLNSHDGTTSLRMFLGLIRFACMNGIIAGTALNDIKLVHSKNITSRVPDAIDYISHSLPQLIEQIQVLNNKTFTNAALKEFVKLCVDARLSNVHNIVKVDYDSALRTVRLEDRGNDAFTIMNKVQERVLRGGIRYVYDRKVKDGDGNLLGHKRVVTKTRNLKSVSGQVKLNRLVYDKALELVA